jgi:hypothetical protein
VAGEEVRIQIFHEHIMTSAQKQACHQHLTFFFVFRQPSMYTRGYGGQIGWRLAVGKVAVNAMMEGRETRGEYMSCAY